VPEDHVCRVIDAFVGSLVDLVALRFSKAQAAATGRPAYDPADLLKLYLCGAWTEPSRGAQGYAAGRERARLQADKGARPGVQRADGGRC